MNKPCDCIEILSGQYVPRCECGNSGDLMTATMWCAEKNDEPIRDALKRENDQLREELAEAKREIERLEREGSPGVVHAVDAAFHDLAIKQRDHAWIESAERLERAEQAEARALVLQDENARLREEQTLLRHQFDWLTKQNTANHDAKERLREELAEASGNKPCCQDWDNCSDRCIPLQKEWKERAEKAEARALAAENALEVIAGIRKCDDRSIRSNSDYAMRVLQKRDAASKGSAK